MRIGEGVAVADHRRPVVDHDLHRPPAPDRPEPVDHGGEPQSEVRFDFGSGAGIAGAVHSAYFTGSEIEDTK